MRGPGTHLAARYQTPHDNATYDSGTYTREVGGDWAASYLTTAMHGAAVVFCVLAVGGWQRKEPFKARIGNLMGSGGLAMLLTSFAAVAWIRLPCLPVSAPLPAGALITTGIGGALAGWRR
jgi:hypothetical protein